MKIFLFLFISLNISFASYEQVRIGKIDSYYKNKISEQELLFLLKEIENLFESELKTNVFDYSENGKPIDILHVSNKQLEENLSKKIEKLDNKKEKLLQLQDSFLLKKDEINQLQESLNSQTKILNNKIEALNNYIKELNNKKSLPKNEYNSVKDYLRSEEEKINQERKIQKDIQSDLTKTVNNYKRKFFIYNSLINESNILIKEIESINVGMRIINGRTFGFQETTLKTSYINNKEVKEKSIKNSMTKIEIYGFDSIEHLKIILAHEIAHLLGVPHINVKGALMNPILQEEQKEKLFLTLEDIENFRNNF
jgi:hypothetical protein